ncbi:hypothetical protein DPMN_121362 [Dreissena polymorpha]|uniref:Uncharacterized protein n=1 Tax=Dreissena polymorpha TaxID=45954 RepID=A0A9D4GML2_DREPO|nr:hypothetical protein DPMN_121362 [Dreissena polymorpha]
MRNASFKVIDPTERTFSSQATISLASIATDRLGLVDKASASGSGGRRFEPHGERLSKDGCLSWDLIQYGRLVSRER